MKFRWPFLLLICFLLTSCVIEKRLYRNGFYVNWKGENQEKTLQFQDTTTGVASKESVVVVPDEDENRALETDSAMQGKTADVMQPEVKATCDAPESRQHEVKENDDPQPEKNDKVNPKIAWLTAGGFVFELTLGLILLFGTVSWMGWLVLLAMLIGLGMFVLATYLRNKYTMRIAAGEKDPKLRLSAHYHRFRVLLHMYFAAGAIGFLGWFFLYTAGAASGILSLLGVILFSSGVVLLAGIALVLLVLFALYFLRWRKDPTGYKPPRDPHPPKDR